MYLNSSARECTRIHVGGRLQIMITNIITCFRTHLFKTVLNFVIMISCLNECHLHVSKVICLNILTFQSETNRPFHSFYSTEKTYLHIAWARNGYVASQRSCVCVTIIVRNHSNILRQGICLRLEMPRNNSKHCDRKKLVLMSILYSRMTCTIRL